MWNKIKFSILLVLFAAISGIIAVFTLRPARSNYVDKIVDGAIYTRIALNEPRNVLIHYITINLRDPSIKFFVTPANKKSTDAEIGARTTSEFLKEFSVNIAINGGNFKPFYVDNPFSYYPRSGDPVNVLGRAISDGVSYSEASSGWPVICFSSQNKILIDPYDCPESTIQAISGSLILLKDGSYPNVKSELSDENKIQPQSAIAVDRTMEKMWLIVVDGRQPWYSDGLSAVELSSYLSTLGAYNAILLDGGGSSTLVVEKNGRAVVLNSPVHTYIPMRERPVANHLGVLLNVQ